MTSTCTDWHGRPVADTPFSSEQFVRTLVSNGVVISRDFANQPYGYLLNGYPLQVSSSGLATGSIQPAGDVVALTVARTNPSRPTVTIPTLIQDFIELPAMLRDVGKLVTSPVKGLSPKQLANRNLAVQFGWIPLVGDVKVLLNLQSAVLKRQTELNRLYSTAGLRRRLKLAEDTQVAVYNETWGLASGSITFVTQTTVERKCWSTIRWRPTGFDESVDEHCDRNRKARQLVLGLTVEGLAQGAWDVIPWTWLTDWFFDVGSLMLQRSNAVPAEHGMINIMNELTETTAPVTVKTVNCSTNSVAVSGFYRRTVKTRAVFGSATPGFSVPFLGARRLSVLGSLFVQRFTR